MRHQRALQGLEAISILSRPPDGPGLAGFWSSEAATGAAMILGDGLGRAFGLSTIDLLAAVAEAWESATAGGAIAGSCGSAPGAFGSPEGVF